MYVGSNILIALEAGDYPVYVRDANDCIYNSNVTIGEPDELQVSIIGNGIDNDEITIMSGDDLSLDADINNAVGNVTYEWSAAWCGTLSCPGDTLTDCDTVMICSNPIANPDFTNDYYLTIIDENGCEAEDNLQVHVKKIRLVEVPTGFTPTGDNVNEMLLVHGRSGTMIKTFQVFDRWGELLFQDNDLPINDNTRGWDGTFKNTELPAGVYVWYIEAEYADGMTETFKGETTLIR
jgi:gliding motility-associated-like protein